MNAVEESVVERPATPAPKPQPKIDALDVEHAGTPELAEEYRRIDVGAFEQNPNLDGEQVKAAREFGRHLLEHVRKDGARIAQSFDKKKTLAILEAGLMYAAAATIAYNDAHDFTVTGSAKGIPGAKPGKDELMESIVPNATAARRYASEIESDPGFAEGVKRHPAIARALATKQQQLAAVEQIRDAFIEQNPALPDKAHKVAARVMVAELNGTFATSLGVAAQLTGPKPGDTDAQRVREVVAMGDAAVGAFVEMVKLSNTNLLAAAEAEENKEPPVAAEVQKNYTN